MAERGAFLDRIARQLGSKSERVKRLKVRALLKGCGCTRRDARSVAFVHEALHARGLRTTLTATSPSTLDDEVEVRLVGSSQDPSAAKGHRYGARILPAGVTRVGTSGAAVPAGVSPRPPVGAPTGAATVAAGPQVALDWTEVARQATMATVSIRCECSEGAGFLVHAGGLVLTARHVVDCGAGCARRVAVRLGDGTRASGIVFRAHRALDFALLWLDRKGPFATLPLGDARRVRPAEPVLAVGHPHSLTNTVSAGIVCNAKSVADSAHAGGAATPGVEYIQTDAAIDEGNSGGPLINSAGEAVGINLWVIEGVDSARFALPIDYVFEEVEAALMAGRRRCLLGRFCLSCGNLQLERPRPYCPACGSRDLASGERSPDDVRV